LTALGKLKPSYKPLYKFGGEALDSTCEPCGIATHQETGNFFLCAFAATVFVFSPDWKFLYSFNGNESSNPLAILIHPASLVVDSKGNVIIADRDGKIRIFTTAGTFQDAFGAKGKQPGELFYPRDIVVDHSNNIVVSDDAHRVQYFTPTGELIRTVGSEGTNPGELRDPIGIAIDLQENLIVAEFSNDRIQVSEIPPWPIFSHLLLARKKI
jgi:tripartite motif-containing protein 2/3